jgi:hypothetical protein
MKSCIAFAAALFLSSCAYDVGNGKLVYQSRPADTAFTRVAVGSGIHAEIGLGPPAIGLSADENLIDLVETFVDGETLVVRVRPDHVVSTSLGIKATLVNVVLLGLEASGGSTVNAVASSADVWQVTASGGSPVSIHNVDAGRFVADASGGSHVTASGEALTVDLVASGGSHVDTSGVFADDALIDGSGGSQFSLTASHSVKGMLSGGSTATVFGSPYVRSVSMSGGSTIDWAE